MVDFIDEVNEELRRERLNVFWQKMGKYIIALSVFIVAATVASTLWSSYKNSRQEKASVAFMAAEKQRISKDSAAADAAFSEIAKSHAGGFAALARLKQASAQRDAGKIDEAVSTYLALANDYQADEAQRAFARIYAGQLMSSAKKPYAEVEAVLNPLAVKNSPFAPLAKEQLAYAAVAAGEKEKALSLLKELASDAQVSGQLKQRATVLQSALQEKSGS